MSSKILDLIKNENYKHFSWKIDICPFFSQEKSTFSFSCLPLENQVLRLQATPTSFSLVQWFIFPHFCSCAFAFACFLARDSESFDDARKVNVKNSDAARRPVHKQGVGEYWNGGDEWTWRFWRRYFGKNNTSFILKGIFYPYFRHKRRILKMNEF